LRYIILSSVGIAPHSVQECRDDTKLRSELLRLRYIEFRKVTLAKHNIPAKEDGKLTLQDLKVTPINAAIFCLVISC